MSYVIPNSVVQLFKGVPLNDGSEDTLYFGSVSDQNSYFNSLTKAYTGSNFSFIRAERETIRVAAGYSTVYQCNYMRFNNTGSGNKWFYAFVTNVRYINEATTEIEYKIDVLQTWLPGVDYQLKQCMVEREHSATDVIGENTTDERLYLDDVIYEKKADYPLAFLGFAVLWNYGGNTGYPFFKYDGRPSGYVLVYDSFVSLNDASRREEFSKFLDHEKDNIIAIYTIPNQTLQRIDASTYVEYDKSFTYAGALGQAETITFDVAIKSNAFCIPYDLTINLNNNGAISGYTPRNKKLYTAPYLRYNVIDNSGVERSYLPQNFNSDRGVFRITCNMTNPVQFSIAPINYQKVSTTDNMFGGTLPTTKQVITASIPGSFAAGQIMEEFLIRSVPQAVSVGTTAAFATGNLGAGLVGAAVTGVNTGVGLLENAKGLLSSETHGASGSSVPLDLARGNADNYVGFAIYEVRINENSARRIDFYFNTYGYKLGAVKVPNINVRSKFTYTKTSGASHKSINVPAQDMKEINAKFDAGIRFHKTAATIGNTDVDNATL